MCIKSHDIVIILTVYQSRVSGCTDIEWESVFMDWANTDLRVQVLSSINNKCCDDWYKDESLAIARKHVFGFEYEYKYK